MNGKVFFTILAIIIPAFAFGFSDEKFTAEYDRANDAEAAGNYREAIGIYEKLLPTVPQDSVGYQSDLYASLLLCHLRLGEIEVALTCGEKGLTIDEQSGDKERIASSLSNLASVMLSANRLEKAEGYLIRSIAIEREIEDYEKLAIRLGMLSELYMKKGEPAKALPLAREALDLDTKGGREKKAAIRMSQLGNALLLLDRPAEARRYLTKALTLHRKYKNVVSENITLSSLGSLEHKLGNLAQAERYLKESITLSRSIGQIQPQVTAYQELAHVSHELGDPLAFDYLKQHMVLKDSLTKQQVQQQISDMEVKYETYQKEQELIRRELVIEQQRIIFIGLAIILVLIIALVFYLVRTIHLKNQNIELRNRFMQIISHDLKNPALAQQKSLHMLASNLSRFDTDTLQQLITRMAEDSDQNVNLLYSLLDWARLQTGRLVFTPTDIDLRSIADEVVAQHRSQADVKQVALRIEAADDMNIVHADRQMVETMLRNIVSNAIKFTSPGGEVIVRIKDTEVQCDDNGIGFGAQGGEKGTGLGLDLVRKLAEINHADFKICKKSDVGSLASIRFTNK